MNPDTGQTTDSDPPEPTAESSVPSSGGVEPTKDDLRNGWTKETLALYLEEQEARLDLKPREMVRRGQANSKYDPFRWRG